MATATTARKSAKPADTAKSETPDVPEVQSGETPNVSAGEEDATESETNEMTAETTETVNPLANHDVKTIRDFWVKAESALADMNAAHSAVVNAQPPSDDKIQELIAESADSDVVTLRTEIDGMDAEIARLEADRDAKLATAEKLVKSSLSIASDEEIEKLTKAFTVAGTKARGVLNLIKEIAGTENGYGLPEVVEFVTKLELPTLRGTQTTTATAGVQKVLARISQGTVTRGDVTKVYDKFGPVANFLQIDTVELAAHWLAAAGKRTWQEVTETVTFTVDDATVKIVPRQS